MGQGKSRRATNGDTSIDSYSLSTDTNTNVQKLVSATAQAREQLLLHMIEEESPSQMVGSKDGIFLSVTKLIHGPNFTGLDDFLLLRILGYCSGTTLLNAGSTCKRMTELVHVEALWMALWMKEMQGLNSKRKISLAKKLPDPSVAGYRSAWVQYVRGKIISERNTKSTAVRRKSSAAQAKRFPFIHKMASITNHDSYGGTIILLWFATLILLPLQMDGLASPDYWEIVMSPLFLSLFMILLTQITVLSLNCVAPENSELGIQSWNLVWRIFRFKRYFSVLDEEGRRVKFPHTSRLERFLQTIWTEFTTLLCLSFISTVVLVYLYIVRGNVPAYAVTFSAAMFFGILIAVLIPLISWIFLLIAEPEKIIRKSLQNFSKSSKFRGSRKDVAFGLLFLLLFFGALTLACVGVLYSFFGADNLYILFYPILAFDILIFVTVMAVAVFLTSKNKMTPGCCGVLFMSLFALLPLVFFEILVFVKLTSSTSYGFVAMFIPIWVMFTCLLCSFACFKEDIDDSRGVQTSPLLEMH
jgi:hypothetical protein